jgi:hypothetical protein
MKFCNVCFSKQFAVVLMTALAVQGCALFSATRTPDDVSNPSTTAVGMLPRFSKLELEGFGPGYLGCVKEIESARQLGEKAEKGDAEAQYALAMLYTRAVALGDVEMLASGDEDKIVELLGDARNEMEAIEAEKVKPCPFAPLVLGDDETEKIRLLKLASDQGLDLAQQVMEDIPGSLEKNDGYQESDESDNPASRSTRGFFKIYRSDSNDTLEPDKVCVLVKGESEDEDEDAVYGNEETLGDCKKAVVLRNRAVSGDRDAQFEFASFLFPMRQNLFSSLYGRRNLDSGELAGLKWMLKAAHANQADAQYELARYCRELGNSMCAVAWMLKAAQQGHEEAWKEVPPEEEESPPKCDCDCDC